MSKHELDVEVMRRLYEFGGLQVYTVTWFDPLTFATEVVVVTFSEEFARARYASIKDTGAIVRLDIVTVKFNGAFAKKDAEKPGADKSL